MVPLLDIAQVDKYLDIGEGPYVDVTECFGDITCLYGKTDDKVPFIIKFVDDSTIQIRHGLVKKLFKFTEENYPLK